MNTNESPYPPPQVVLDEVVEAIRASLLNRYPDRDANDLYAVLGDHTGRDPSQLWIANGSNEVLQHLMLAFGGAGRSVMTFEPTYPVHGLIARITGAEHSTVERGPAFEIDLDAAVGAIRRERPAVVIACSPNNPTGGVEPPDTIRALCAETQGLVVVDEAYIDFASASESVAHLLDEEPRLVVVRTFSKAWRLAGVRLGYLMASAEVIEGLRRVRLPYHLSTITQAFGLAALRHLNEGRAAIEAVIDQRDRIAVELQAAGLLTYPSHANFIMLGATGPGMWDELLARGILVRDLAGVHPRLDGCLRVSAGTVEESGAFLDAVAELVDSEVGAT